MPHVGIGIQNGRAGYYGLMRCGLAWACPVCRSSIQAERAADVIHVAQWHRRQGGQTYLISLTVRHGLGDDLKALRKGVAIAWRKMQAGRQWGEWKARVGMTGSVRALETTHGANGFHPHIHALILAKHASEQDVERWRAQLSARWQVIVERTLGREHRPSDRRGVDLRESKSAEYIAKLGLEVAGSDAKRARASSSRSPMEIGQDYAARPNVRDAAIWRAYAKGMHGARMLTWSRGLRAAAGLSRERTDEEIVADESGAVLVGHIAGAGWDRMIRVPGLALRVLEAIDAHGAAAGYAMLEDAIGDRAPPDW